MSEPTLSFHENDDGETIATVTITKATPVVYHDDGEFGASTVLETSGEFVRVNGRGESPGWLHRSDIVAIGVYTDDPGVDEVVLGD